VSKISGNFSIQTIFSFTITQDFQDKSKYS
jgi:hypothetical protein